MGILAMMHLSAALLLLNLTIALPALGAPADFSRLRNAADVFAEKAHPGAKLWRIDVTASYESGSLEIHEEAFYYFYEQRQGMNVMKVHVLAPKGAGPPRIEERNWGGPPFLEKWQTTPVPGNVLSPEEAMRRLNRSLPADPYRSPSGLLEANRYSGLFNLKLVQAGAALADSSRNQFQWNTLATAMGMKSGDVAQYFSRTAPTGKWVWWTVVEQNRPYPGSNPRAVGTPRRVQEYIYIDAITGAVTSHCAGPSGPVSCEPEPQPGTQAKSGPLQMVSGEVKSASAQKLVIVTDRDTSVSLRKGMEMEFDLTHPHLQRFNLQKGDHVTVKYEKQSNRMIAHTISLRPSERPR